MAVGDRLPDTALTRYDRTAAVGRAASLELARVAAATAFAVHVSSCEPAGRSSALPDPGHKCCGAVDHELPRPRPRRARADGYPATDEDAAHLTPAQHDHINFYGTYSFEVETELRREGHRPLRSPAA